MLFKRQFLTPKITHHTSKNRIAIFGRQICAKRMSTTKNFGQKFDQNFWPKIDQIFNQKFNQNF